MKSEQVLEENDPMVEETASLNYFDKWCEMTGWHGILEFHTTKQRFWKISWLLLIVVGGFFAINQSVAMILDFTSDEEWVTSVTYEKPRDGYLKWPNITICGLRLKPLADKADQESLQAAIRPELDLYKKNMTKLYGNQSEILEKLLKDKITELAESRVMSVCQSFL